MSSKLILSGKTLKEIGYSESPLIGKIIQMVRHNFDTGDKEYVMKTLKELLTSPEKYFNDPVWGSVAQSFIIKEDDSIQLTEVKEYSIYGSDFIEEGANLQMSIAMRLPITVAGALMPDAHHGYGLPIGGVLAVKNAIIPYGVGVDIGCRMSLSIFDIQEKFFEENQSKFKRELIAQTAFGAGSGFKGSNKADHPVLSDPRLFSTPLLRGLADKAWTQLGSSGSGNHFVEFGIIEIFNDKNELNLPPGKYLALLSHSGSRGLGATIANHYTKLAQSVCILPSEAARLAYFDLQSAEGEEYWEAMNLAGDYASANHEVIHQKITKAIGAEAISRVENHHNFAWKEMLNGEELIVHRKGATPAGKGVLGIIPGSMAAPGYLVSGKGNPYSINSASHGAGRKMSRTKAKQAFTKSGLQSFLKSSGVTLIGGGLDESPDAYKDIRMVMRAQEDLVDILGEFNPKIVIMDA